MCLEGVVVEDGLGVEVRVVEDGLGAKVRVVEGGLAAEVDSAGVVEGGVELLDVGKVEEGVAVSQFLRMIWTPTWTSTTLKRCRSVKFLLHSAQPVIVLCRDSILECDEYDL